MVSSTSRRAFLGAMGARAVTASAVLTFHEGVDSTKLRGWLWGKHRVLTVAIMHDQFEGLRISPSVYSTIEDVDRFCEVMEHAVKHGIEG